MQANLDKEVSKQVEELKPIPESISHKKLNAFINNAKKEIVCSKESKYINSRMELNGLLLSWEKLSKKVVKEINTFDFDSSKEKSSKALMALGAMEVHINLAIQALKAYDKE